MRTPALFLLAAATGCVDLGGSFSGNAPPPAQPPDAGPVLGEDDPDAGPAVPADDGRVKDGLAALYKFQGIAGAPVPDVSGAGEPLDLTIADLGAVTIAPDGLTIDAPTILSSQRALKVYEPCV